MHLNDYQLRHPLRANELHARFCAQDPQQQLVEIHVFRERSQELRDWNAVVKRVRLASFARHAAFQRILEVATSHDPPFVVLEWLAGVDLETQQSERRLTVHESLQLVHSLAAGLVAAHRLRLAHGGIEPGRISLRSNDSWTLDWSDWRAGRTAAERIESQEFSFSAPEQRDSEDVETPGDVYSLIAVLQWLLQGRADELSAIAEVWYTLRDECLAEEPSARPSAGQLVARLSTWMSTWSRSSSLEAPAGSDMTRLQTALEPPQDSASLAATRSISRDTTSPMPQQLGRYQIIDKLGEGGMGAVFRARDLADGTVVAVKILGSAVVDNADIRQRFAKEARMLAKANNPFVANLLAFDEDDGAAYLAVEFVPGGSVGEWLKGHGQLTERVAVALIADVLRGLSVAHRRGIIHRDIKPDNMLLTEKGLALLTAGESAEQPTVGVPLVKLADFGLARSQQQTESLAITHDGTLLGTPLYMSPEQCRGLPTDARSDVYSLGATLFHLLAGRPPFEAGSHVGVMNKHCQEIPPPLSKLQPRTSEAIERVVAKSLSKNPDARYASAEEFLADLESMLRGAPTSIGLHPARPDTGGHRMLTFEFHWELSSSPEQLWPMVSNTDRVNQAMGLPSVRYATRTDPGRGVRRFAEASVAGQTLAWEEHPYEWVEGRRMSVLREFTRGPFRWFMNIVELRPLDGGGTLMSQTFHVVPLHWLGRWLARYEIGRNAGKSLTRVYEQIDGYLTDDSRHDPSRDAFRKSLLLSAGRRARLEQRLQALRTQSLNPLVMETLRQYLEHAADQEVARIRPLAFADRFNLDRGQVVEACLRGAREGLLVLLWDILCPSCRIPADVQETLTALRDHGHCQACNVDFELDFGNSVEVIFRAHPEIRDVETRTYCIGGPAFSAHVVAQVRLVPGERFAMEVALAEGAYRVRGPQLPFVIDFRVAPQGAVGRWELPLSRPTSPELVPLLRTQNQVIILTNDTSQELLVRIERTTSRRDALTAADASSLALFREMFPDQVLSPGQMVSVTSVTLLLVQAHNAAELYRQWGDGVAFSSIRQLFSLVEAEVARHGGAVVKILGDGVMASFGDTVAAVRAALDLLAAAKHSSASLPLQLAIHRGPAMVATLNDRLDYFGQTVHDVHDVLHRCHRDEFLLTDAVAGLPEVFSVLRDRKCRVEILSSGDDIPAEIIHRCTLGA